jgi:hypothetical protein
MTLCTSGGGHIMHSTGAWTAAHGAMTALRPQVE